MSEPSQINADKNFPPLSVGAVADKNFPPLNVGTVADKNFSSLNVETVADKNFSSLNVGAVIDKNRLEKIIAQTAQIVAEKNLEPPPSMSRQDFARQMANLSDAEIDAKQKEYQRRLEMNQRIREFKAALPENLSADDKREAVRIYTLREREKLLDD